MNITSQTTKNDVCELSVADMKKWMYENGVEFNKSARKAVLVNTMWEAVAKRAAALRVQEEQEENRRQFWLAQDWAEGSDFIAKLEMVIEIVERARQVDINKQFENFRTEINNAEMTYEVADTLRWRADGLRRAAEQDRALAAFVNFSKKVLRDKEITEEQYLNLLEQQRDFAVDRLVDMTVKENDLFTVVNVQTEIRLLKWVLSRWSKGVEALQFFGWKVL